MKTQIQIHIQIQTKIQIYHHYSSPTQLFQCSQKRKVDTNTNNTITRKEKSKRGEKNTNYTNTKLKVSSPLTSIQKPLIQVCQFVGARRARAQTLIYRPCLPFSFTITPFFINLGHHHGNLCLGAS